MDLMKREGEREWRGRGERRERRRREEAGRELVTTLEDGEEIKRAGCQLLSLVSLSLFLSHLLSHFIALGRRVR